MEQFKQVHTEDRNHKKILFLYCSNTILNGFNDNFSLMTRTKNPKEYAWETSNRKIISIWAEWSYTIWA